MFRRSMSGGSTAPTAQATASARMRSHRRSRSGAGTTLESASLGMCALRMQDDGGRNHGPGQAAAPDFVDARDEDESPSPQDVLDGPPGRRSAAWVR